MENYFCLEIKNVIATFYVTTVIFFVRVVRYKLAILRGKSKLNSDFFLASANSHNSEK